jgi:hypothetical protein
LGEQEPARFVRPAGTIEQLVVRFGVRPDIVAVVRSRLHIASGRDPFRHFRRPFRRQRQHEGRSDRLDDMKVDPGEYRERFKRKGDRPGSDPLQTLTLGVSCRPPSIGSSQEMNIAVTLALLQVAGAVEALPIDERMAAYEAVVPELRENSARIESDIGRLGRREPGWETSGMSAESAITAGTGSVAEDVLGEWEIGGHGVVLPVERPLAIPQGLRRYSVRDYSGPVDYHTYHRAEAGIVFHTFGTVRRIGNAECQTPEGIEIISRGAWRDWPTEIAIAVFSAARMTRDDPRTYCIIYRAGGSNRFSQLAYTPGGEPYITVNEGAQTFVVTSRAEATSRIFD